MVIFGQALELNARLAFFMSRTHSNTLPSYFHFLNYLLDSNDAHCFAKYEFSSQNMSLRPVKNFHLIDHLKTF